MSIEEITKIINEADDSKLCKYVALWAIEHDDFRTYITHALNLPISEIDFAEELERVIRDNTGLIQSHYFERLIVDWGKVYYRLIVPWYKEAHTLSTGHLLQLVEAITTQVSSHVMEDDFTGDDYYGDDYSCYLSDIFGCLGNLSGMLMIRDDLTINALISFREVVKNGKSTDISNEYVNTPYDDMLQMIQMRLEAGEVTCGIFDAMIENAHNCKAGDWVAAKSTSYAAWASSKKRKNI